MARLVYNNQSGLLGASLTSGGTTITFATAPNFATISGSDYIPLVLGPGTVNFEIVYLTAYTALATTGTIARAQEDATNWPAVAHSNGTAWACAPTKQDISKPAGRIYLTSATASVAPVSLGSTSYLVGGMTTSGGALVVPTTGYYQVNGAAQAIATSGLAFLYPEILVNGSIVSQGSQAANFSGSYGMQGAVSDVVYVTAGQTIALGTAAYQIGNLTAGTYETYLSAFLAVPA